MGQKQNQLNTYKKCVFSFFLIGLQVSSFILTKQCICLYCSYFSITDHDKLILFFQDDEEKGRNSSKGEENSAFESDPPPYTDIEAESQEQVSKL